MKSQISQPTYFMVPQWCQRNQHFIGRAELLQKLRDKLCDERPNKFNHRVALFGMGGVGKTQVSIQYVVTYKAKYNSVFWITAVDQPSLILGFQEIATKTKLVDTEGMDGVSVAREVLRWLEKQNSWLLVMDNVDDISVVNNYLPDVAHGQGHILLTTRDPNATGIPAQGLEVEVFDSQTAANLLLLRADLEDNSTEEIKLEAIKIVKELGYLALAIEQVAAYIRESLKDVFKFLSVYSAHRKKLLKARPRENWAYEHVVATTWSLSFEAVKKDIYAAQLLNLFAFLNPDEILVEFLEAGKDGLPDPLNMLVGDLFEMNKALGILEQFSLIRRSGSGRIVSIHRLVQTVIQDNLQDEDKRMFMEIAVALFLCAFPDFEEDKRQICRRYQSQVVGPLLAVIELGTENVAEALFTVGSFLYKDGKYHEGKELEYQAVEICSVLFGPEDRRTLWGMNNLALTYLALGCMEEAAALIEKALGAGKRTLGEEHPDTLQSMGNLAEAYRALGWMKESATLNEKVLEARKRTLGEGHPDILLSMNNLALTYFARGQMIEAVSLLENVLETWKRTLGEEHPNTLQSMNNLAVAYCLLGQMKESAALHDEVIEVRKRTLGKEHPDTLQTMGNLAEMYRVLGLMKESVTLNEDVLDVRKRILGEEHPNTLLSMNNLAWTYSVLGQMKEAASLHEKALEAQKRILGKEHPNTLVSMNNLALVYRHLGQVKEAATLQEQVLETQKRTLGEEHPDTLRSKNHLAETYHVLSQMEEAVSWHEKMQQG